MISHSESRLNVQAKTSFKVENLDILLLWLIERKNITTWMKHVSTLSSVQCSITLSCIIPFTGILL